MKGIIKEFGGDFDGIGVVYFKDGSAARFIADSFIPALMEAFNGTLDRSVGQEIEYEMDEESGIIMSFEIDVRPGSNPMGEDN